MALDGNIFSCIPDNLPEELCESILRNPHFKIGRIVSRGHASPEHAWYDQATSEWVLLLKGSARLLFKDERQEVTMAPGDFLNIDAHREHRVVWTDPNEETVWLVVHY